jgi:hypothetical protein
MKIGTVKTAIFFIVLAAVSMAAAQEAEIAPQWLTTRWQAKWCSHPDGPGHDAALFLFRKQFTLDEKPAKFIVHVSADQRYQLYVNGARVAYGPARGDVLHWRFETLDISQHLAPGVNVLAAKVWSAGTIAPWAQHTAFTAFIMQGDGDAERVINTPSGWKVFHDTAWEPAPRPGTKPAHNATGPTEKFYAEKHAWGWMAPDFDDAQWAGPVETAEGVPLGLMGDGSSLWTLIPRPIPLMEEKTERFPQVVRAKKADVPREFLDGKAQVHIPANTQAVILLDREVLTNGYPELVVSGGAGASIRLSYEESLFKYPEVMVGNLIKLNRNTTKKCQIRQDNRFDEFFPDGGASRLLSPLWWRTFRYLQMDIETGGEPLTLEDFRIIATGYPFHALADFDSSDPTLKTIWETGWRTARLCAGETYFDCPYYEQLQYGGDTRVQMMISYYVSGDDRLARNAIELMADSRIPEGITQSRYPSRMTQVIPTFSLAWIGMIYDHWLMHGDLELVKKHLWGMRQTLAWFEEYRLDNGLVGGAPWWNFVDWSWPGGVPPGMQGKGSSIISLQYAMALAQVAELESLLGNHADAARWSGRAEQIIAAVRDTCWNKDKGLLADTPGAETYSQHAAALGVLSGAIPQNQWKQAVTNALTGDSITQCSLYFRYYLIRAAVKAGLGGEYLSMLGPWRDMLDMGLTTWPETPEQTPRSDCHAWSASPTIDLLSVVCGVKPAEPGFATVDITPHIGSLEWVACKVPHPQGIIKVRIDTQGGRLRADVELPGSLQGVLHLGTKTIPLKPGRQNATE